MHSRATIERKEDFLKRQRRLEIVKCLLYFESLHATEIISTQLGFGRKRERRKRRSSDDPGHGDPLGLGVEFTGDDQQLLKGRRQVAVDDDVVEKVAVVELDPLAAADHFGQLVVGESARRILVERRTGVGGRTSYLS